MRNCYEIFLADQPIGTAEVTQEGLYYRFWCCCQLSGEVMYQIKVVCEGRESSLGVCVPLYGGFGVETKVAIKKIGKGEMRFYVTPRHFDLQGKFVPISADAPFVYIEKLENAHMAVVNGVQGVVIQ